MSIVINKFLPYNLLTELSSTDYCVYVFMTIDFIVSSRTIKSCQASRSWGIELMTIVINQFMSDTFPIELSNTGYYKYNFLISQCTFISCRTIKIFQAYGSGGIELMTFVINHYMTDTLPTELSSTV